MAYHHAIACISSKAALPPLYLITPLGVYRKAFAMDDIQDFVLMILHGFAVICASVRSHTQNKQNIFFAAHRQQKQNICRQINVLFLFIQAAGLVYHRRAKCGVYHQGRRAALVNHHAPACIFLAAWWYSMLRIDDMPQQVADYIHAFSVIEMRECGNPLNYLLNYDIIALTGWYYD